jgi:hypothetical protein
MQRHEPTTQALKKQETVTCFVFEYVSRGNGEDIPTALGVLWLACSGHQNIAYGQFHFISST